MRRILLALLGICGLLFGVTSCLPVTKAKPVTAPVAAAKPPAARPIPPVPAAPTVLPMDWVSTMVVDSANQHVWLAGDDKVVVVDFAGKVVKSLTLPGATGLALQSSRHTIYVAETASHRIIAVDTLSFGARTLVTTGAIAPAYLAVAGDRLWVTYDVTVTPHGRSQIGVVNPADSRPTFTSLAVAPIDSEGVLLRPAAAGEHRRELAFGDSDTFNQFIYTYLTSGSTLIDHGNTLSQMAFGTNISGLQLSSDGQYIIIAPVGYEQLLRYRFSDLSEAGAYNVDEVWDAHKEYPYQLCDATSSAGITNDGKYVFGGPSIGWFSSTSEHLLHPSQPLPSCMGAFSGFQASDDGRRTFAVTFTPDLHGREMTIATGPEDPAAAKPVPQTGLKMDSFDDMVVDPAVGRVFASPGLGGSEVSVLDLSGKVVAQIPQMWGASEMALSGDGKTLYAALSYADAIASIDATTLKVNWLHPTGQQGFDSAVAIAGGRLWAYAATAADGGAELASTDLNNPKAPWVAAPGYTQDLDRYEFTDNLLAPSAGSNQLLVIGQSDAVLPKYGTVLYNIGGAGNTSLTAVAANQSLAGSVTFSADHQHLYASNLAEPQSYSASTLAMEVQYPRSSGGAALAGTPDGAYLIAGDSQDNVREYTAAGQFVRQLVTGPDDGLPVQRHGLAVSPDGRTLFVVAPRPSLTEIPSGPLLSVIPLS